MSRFPFAKTKAPQIAAPRPQRGGAQRGVARVAAVGLGKLVVVLVKLLRATLAGAWLWRDTLAPLVVPLLVLRASVIVGAHLPHPLRAVAMVALTLPIFILAVRHGWAPTGWRLSSARRKNEQMARTIRREWPDICAKSHLVNRDNEYPPAVVTVTTAGVLLRLSMPRGLEIGNVEACSDEFAASFHCERVSVSATKTGARKDSALVEILAVFDDPLRQLPPTSPLVLSPHERKVADPVDIGVDEYGRPVTLTMVGHNLLAGGIPGSGKSGMLQNIVGHYAMCDPALCRLYLIDPKLVELSQWKDRATVFVGGDDTVAVMAVLREIRDEIGATYARLNSEGTGARKFTPDQGVFTLLVIDEFADYAGVPEFKTIMGEIVRKGRAAGVAVIAATQRPSKEAIPRTLSNLFSLKMAFLTKTSADSDIILDDPRADASRIDPNTQGVCLFKSATGNEATRMRAYYLRDGELSALVAHAGTADRRPGAVPAAVDDNCFAPAAPPAATPAAPEPAVVRTLTIDTARARVPEKLLDRYQGLHPQDAVTTDQASQLLRSDLAAFHGDVLAPTGHEQGRVGYWVNLATMKLLFDVKHHLRGVYPPSDAAAQEDFPPAVLAPAATPPTTPVPAPEATPAGPEPRGRGTVAEPTIWRPPGR